MTDSSSDLLPSWSFTIALCSIVVDFPPRFHLHINDHSTEIAIYNIVINLANVIDFFFQGVISQRISCNKFSFQLSGFVEIPDSLSQYCSGGFVHNFDDLLCIRSHNTFLTYRELRWDLFGVVDHLPTRFMWKLKRRKWWIRR